MMELHWLSLRVSHCLVVIIRGSKETIRFSFENEIGLC
jgi:hypothetical protein